MKIARQIKWLDSGKGVQALFKLTPPMITVDYKDVVEQHDYVVVSAVNAMISGPETYIFSADETGGIKNFSAIEGSFRGKLDIWEAIRNAGYEPHGLALSNAG